MDAPDHVRGRTPLVAGIAQRKPLIERGVTPRHRAFIVDIGSKQVAKAPSIAEVPGQLARHQRIVQTVKVGAWIEGRADLLRVARRRGIERYARKQREFSEQIRSTILQLRVLQDRPDADQGRIDELTNRVEWDTRIFEERRKTMSFVCEVPVHIEQRLFALARAIQQSLE